MPKKGFYDAEGNMVKQLYDYAHDPPSENNFRQLIFMDIRISNVIVGLAYCPF